MTSSIRKGGQPAMSSDCVPPNKTSIQQHTEKVFFFFLRHISSKCLVLSAINISHLLGRPKMAVPVECVIKINERTGVPFSDILILI